MNTFRRLFPKLCAIVLMAIVMFSARRPCPAQDARPNILIAISDDQSYPHASAYGYETISTPAFDRVARAGVLFRNAFTPSPGCSPMRAAFLTGRNTWQLEHAGTHASSFPAKYEVLPDRLESAGYFVGYTGKGWGPGNWQVSGRSRNPAGPVFSDRTADSPNGISRNDYGANFADFLDAMPEGKPFCFWFGATEPHRSFQKGVGREHGLDPSKVVVPPFLPDRPEVRDDVLDYCYEIQWFDGHLGRMLDLLAERGELDNTLVIVTSDNGMAFPRAKANVYEFGVHMPLAICWPASVPAGRTVDDLVNLIDVTATIYEASGVTPPDEYPIAGRGIMNILKSDEVGVVDPSRDAVYSARERHSSSRFNSLGYPQRCVRTHDYLYIRNFRPERWPAGTPQKFDSVTYDDAGNLLQSELGPPHGGYHDIDGCPTLAFFIENRAESDVARYLELAVAKRPAEELYDVRRDPGCVRNLAEDREHADVKARLASRLMDYLRETGDPRVVADDGGDLWETYPRYSSLRWFPTPDWAADAPRSVPEQTWLDERRPR